MTLAAPVLPSAAAPTSNRELPPLRGKLALALQEALTAIARHRAGKQVAADAESFRAQFKQLLRAADDEARAAGYAEADVRLALFAVVVFLDESIMSAPQPMFAQWPRRPLQEEIFGGSVGGEVFFQYLQQLLGRQSISSVCCSGIAVVMADAKTRRRCSPRGSATRSIACAAVQRPLRRRGVRRNSRSRAGAIPG
jgi:hypothetical protein